MPKIRITKHKDGRETAWFRDTQGRVRTRSETNWVRAEQVQKVADYGIALQVAQARAGLGSNGQPMPALKGSAQAVVFLGRDNGRARFGRKTYGDWKSAHGLQPRRDLWGPGRDGHMLEDIRINYLDDRQARIAITTKTGRSKARANELRAPWWGWSPVTVRKLADYAADVFGFSGVEKLYALGLIGDAAFSQAKARRKTVAMAQGSNGVWVKAA